VATLENSESDFAMVWTVLKRFPGGTQYNTYPWPEYEMSEDFSLLINKKSEHIINLKHSNIIEIRKQFAKDC